MASASNAYRRFLFLSLLAGTALKTQLATAQTQPYVWAICQLQRGPGCDTDSFYGDNPQDTCNSDLHFYASGAFVSLVPGTYPSTGQPAWVCNFTANGASLTSYIYGECPEGRQYDNIFASNACSVPPVEKNQGQGGCRADNSGNPQAGDPITICTGNLFEQIVDYRTSGRNVLDFIRSYNSQARRTGAMGVSWRHNWERSLILSSGTPAGSATAIRADGQELTFGYNGSAYISDSDITLTLAVSGSNYTLTDLAETVETYNASGQLLSVAFADGYVQTLNYTSGRLTSVSDNQSRTLGFTYNTDGTLATITDPDSNIFHYHYAAAFPGLSQIALPQLSYVTDPLSHSVTYTYGNTIFPTYLTGITDESGHAFASWSYDTLGEATSASLAGNADLTGVTYNGDGTNTVTMPDGEQVVYGFSYIENAPKTTQASRLSSGGIPAATQNFSYDSNGFLASRTDWNGNSTDYTNNSRGLPTSITEATSTAQHRLTTITWSSSFDLPTEIDTARNTTTFTYDSHGNMTGRTVIDETSQSVPYSTNGQRHTTTYTYDSLGHRLTATDPLGNTTTYTYDSHGNRSTIKDPLGHVTSLTNFTGRGLPQTMTDPNGTVTSFSYDVRGRLLTSTVSPGGGNATTTFTYDAAGNLTQLTLPDNSALSYGYDNAHRLTSVRDSAGDVVTYTLDSMGNITQQQLSNPSGTLVKTQNRVYDALGRLIEVIGASSQTTTYSYDNNGNRTGIKDALSNSTAQGFDAFNRLSAITDPLAHTTSMAYDSQNHRTVVTDPRSFTTSYVYDGFGQVIQEVSPDRGTTTYVRDAASNVTAKTDARGYVTSYSYDALNRVITQIYPAYSSENITYTYDATASGNKGIGHLTGYTDESGQTALTYDERGNVLVKARTIDTSSYTTSYAYDKADHVIQETYPSGRIVTYVYDTAGRVGTVTTKFGGTTTTLASGITWEPFGPVVGVTYGNGVKGTFTYDQDYRETAIVTGKSGLNVQNLSLAYDAVDDITSITDNLDSTRTQTFTYDKDYRLASAHNPNYNPNVTYTYDANGNRTIRNTGQVTTNTYDPASNRLTQTNKAGTLRNFTYTASGNMDTDSRSGGSTNILYGYGGRDLEHAFTVGGVLTSTSRYTALGERVYKWIKSVQTTHYHYDENHHLIAEGNGSTGSIQKEYIWLGDMPLATTDSSGNLYYVHSDQLGTPQKITSGTPTIVWDRIVQPFGEAYSITGTMTYNLGFPGQYYDTEQFLYYNNARTMDPSIGRYIETDPLGWDKTTTAVRNLYGYAEQNPIVNSDSSGLAPGDRRFGFHDDFWRWYHKNIKRSGDPDLDFEDAKDYHEEWQSLGCPYE